MRIESAESHMYTTPTVPYKMIETYDVEPAEEGPQFYVQPPKRPSADAMP